MVTGVRASILEWWAVRNGTFRQLAPARRVAASQRALELRRRSSTTPALARSLTVSGQSLMSAGRHADAEAAARAALEILGERDGLARSDAYLLLARALHGAGRNDEALVAIELAVAGYRGDARATSARLIARLTVALHIQSLILTMLNRPEEALPVNQEVLRLKGTLPLLLRQLTAGTHWRAERHQIGLLHRTGQYEEAVRLGDDPLGWLDLMFRLSPASARPERAELLARLALSHAQVGNLDTAAALAARAVADYQALGEQHRAAAAWGLEMLADRLEALQRRVDADEARREAFEIYTSLEKAAPGSHRESLFRLLKNRVNALWSANDRETAVAAAITSLSAIREVSRPNPALYAPLLAHNLGVSAARASLVGRDDAAELAQEAVGLAQTIADDEQRRPVLAGCLDRQVMVLKRAKRHAEAVIIAEDAVLVWRSLAEAAPGTCDKDLAESLRDWALLLYLLDRDDESAAHGLEAADILRRHADDADYLGVLVAVLYNMALALSTLHRHDEAIDAMAESIEHRRRLAGDGPSTDQQKTLASALRQRSSDFNAIGRDDEARTDINEALQIFRRLETAAPGEFQEEVARTKKQLSRQASRS